MLDNILKLNNDYKLLLSINEINNLLELTSNEKEKLKIVPTDMYDYYVNEQLLSNILVFICNKKLTIYTKLTNDFSQNSIKISIVAAKHMSDNEILLECLMTLQSIAEGSPCYYGDMTKELFSIFKI